MVSCLFLALRCGFTVFTGELLGGRTSAGIPRGYWSFSWLAKDDLIFPSESTSGEFDTLGPLQTEVLLSLRWHLLSPAHTNICVSSSVLAQNCMTHGQRIPDQFLKRKHYKQPDVTCVIINVSGMRTSFLSAYFTFHCIRFSYWSYSTMKHDMETMEMKSKHGTFSWVPCITGWSGSLLVLLTFRAWGWTCIVLFSFSWKEALWRDVHAQRGEPGSWLQSEVSVSLQNLLSTNHKTLRKTNPWFAFQCW